MIQVARATRTQGLHGAVRVELILDNERIMEPGRSLRMAIGGKERLVQIEFFRKQHGRFVLKLTGIDSIEAAEQIIGAEFRISDTELPAAQKGSFYTFHLRGCGVYAVGSGEFLG